MEKSLELAGSDPSKNMETFRLYAISRSGIVTDDLRRKIWPRLASIIFESITLPSQADCEKHPEYNQVVLDVNRSLKRFPPGIAEKERPGLQDQLTRLIVRVLLKHPHLHYYQGYHDVAITFLLVVGEEMGYQIMERLSITHLQSYMAKTMEETTYLLNYMYPMVKSVIVGEISQASLLTCYSFFVDPSPRTQPARLHGDFRGRHDLRPVLGDHVVRPRSS